MYTDNDVFELAQELSEAFVKYGTWFKYQGGKQQLGAESNKENADRKRLTETKMFVDYLKLNFQEFKSSKENMGLIESIIDNTAKIEWGDSAAARIDWAFCKVLVSKNGHEVEL